MNKSAEGNPKSILLGVIIFAFCISILLWFTTNLMSDYSVSTPSDYDSLNKMYNNTKYDDITSSIETSQNDINQSIVQQITDRIQDTWIGQSMKTVKLVLNSKDLVKDYITESSGMLGIPSFVSSFIIMIMVIAIIFAFVYFIRSGK